MIKKILILIFSVIILSGCGYKDEQEVITFSSWGSVSEVEILKKIIFDFEKENPKIKINFMHIPQNYFAKLHLLFASNTPPDVIFINNLNIPVYASKLEDLSDLIDSNLYYDEAIKALSVDEKVLAIPRDISNLVLYVNKDIIKNSPQNWTLEEMLLIAKENTNQNHFGISFEDDVYFMTPYLSYFGEELKESYNLKDSEGYTFYLNLRDKYKVAPKKYQIGSSTLAQMFLDEKIAMYLSGRWMFPKIKEKAHFDWEIMLFPVGKSLQLCDSSGWAIAKDSEHKEAAFKFIKFLSQDNNLSYMTQTGLIVPAQKAIAKSLANEEHAEYLFLKAIEISKKTNVFKNYKKYIDKINLGIRE